MRSRRRAILLRAIPLFLLGLTLLQCGSGSDPVVSQGDIYTGPFYMVGTITTLPSVLTPVPETTDVPVCQTSQITGFLPVGTVLPFQASLLSAGFVVNESDPDRLDFRVTATDTTRQIGVDIQFRDFNQETFFASLPAPVSADLFRAYADTNLLCTLRNRDFGRAMAFGDDTVTPLTWGASDTLQFSEATLQADAAGNLRLVEGSPVSGCFTMTLENTYPAPGGGANQNSRVCVRGCFRIPVQYPLTAVPNLDASVTACIGFPCPSCP